MKMMWLNRRYVGAMAVLILGLQVQGVTLYWDNNTSGMTGNPPTAGGGGGNANWSVGANWWTGTAYQSWTDNNTAAFRTAGGSARTVTIDTTPVTADAIVFDNASWVIAALGGASLTLNNNVPNVTCGGTVGAPSITSPIAGVLNIAGSTDITGGVGLKISGLNTVTSTTINLTAGGVSAQHAAAFGSDGATVTLTAGRLSLDNSIATYNNWPTTLGGGLLRVRNAVGTVIVSTYPGSLTLTANSAIGTRATANVGLICSGPVELAGYTLTVAAGDSSKGVDFQNTLSGSSGSISLAANGVDSVTAGSGVVKLSAANTFSGSATLSGGTLALNHVNALQNATLDTGAAVSSATTVTFILAGNNTYNIGALTGSDNLALGGNTVSVGAKAVDTSFSGIISGTGGLTKLGANTLTLAATNTFSGDITLAASGGTLKIGSAGQLNSGSYAGALSIGSGAIFNYNSSAAQTLSGTISGSGTFRQSGAGTVTISGTLSAPTTIAGGNLAVTAGTTAGTSAVEVNDAGTLVVTATDPSQWSPSSLTLGSLNGCALIFSNVKAGSTAAPLSPASLTVNQTTGITVSIPSVSGTLATGSYPLLANTGLPDGVQSVYVLGAQPTGVTDSSLTVSSGTLYYNITGVVDIWNATSPGANWDFTSTVWAGNALNNTPANTYTNSDAVLFNDAVVGPQTVTVTAAVTPGGISVLNNTTAYTIASDGTYTIGGGGALTKSGSNSLTLSGENTFSGGTTLLAGQLNINSGGSSAANSAIGTGALTISGGVIDNTSAGDVTLLPNNPQNWNADFTYAGSLYNLNLGTGAVTPNASRQVTVSQNNLTVGGAIGGGAVTLTKAGAGTLTLTGANTYSSGTTLSAGTLVVGHAAGLGSTSGTLALNSGKLDLHLDSSVNAYNTTVSGPVTLECDRATDGNGIVNTLGTLGIGANTLSITANTAHNILNNTAYGVTFGTTTLSGSPTFSVANNGTGIGTLTLGGVTGGTFGLTKIGDGTLSLPGANTYSGGTTVNGGTLALSGANTYGTGGMTVANGTANSVLNVNGGASVTTSGSLQIGKVNGANGALNLNNGTLTATAGNTETSFTFGYGSSGYGYLGVTGGTLNIGNASTDSRLQFGGETTGNTTGTGVGVISGGTVNVSQYLLLGRNTGSYASLTLASGGTLNHLKGTGAASANISMGHSGGQAELNLTGGVLDSTGTSLAFRQGNAGTATGIVNLNAGTLVVNALLNAYSGSAYLNFNGGTLKAGAASTAFIPSTMTAVNIFSGGATIDSQANAVTAVAPLSAPVGSGVTGISMTEGVGVNKGSGFIGAPYVSITGGTATTPATAIANMVDDGTGAGTLRVESITVTCPGVYTDVTGLGVAFIGGGSSTAVAGTIATDANASGGLIKTGAGTLTLSGANTYTGPTLVSAGRLQFAKKVSLYNNTPASWTAENLTVESGATNIFNVGGAGEFSSEDIDILAALGTATTGFKSGSVLGFDTTGGNFSYSTGIANPNGGANTRGLLVQGANNILTLSGNNSYTGGTTVNGGELRISSADALNGTSGILVNNISNAKLALSDNITVGSGKTITINGTGNNAGALSNSNGTNEWAGNVTIGSANTRIGSALGGLKVSGVIDSASNPYGILLRCFANSTLNLSGANTYGGDTTIAVTPPASSVMLSGGANRLPTTTKLIMGVTIAYGVLDLNGQDQEVAGLSVGQTSGTFANEIKSAAAATFMVNTASGSPSSYSGIITGAISLEKKGLDMLTLSGANTYSGATTISEGTLALASGGTIDPSTNVVIGSGATLDVSAKATYTWGANASLTAHGSSSAAASLKGGSTGVNLNARPVLLSFTPTAFTGDPSHPALTMTAGTLSLDGSTIAVVNNGGTPLGEGEYTVINVTAGTLSGTPTLDTASGVGAGTGLASGMSGSLVSSSSSLVLKVLPAATTTIALNPSWTSTSTYGDALQFDVTVSGATPTGTVTVKDGGVGGTPIGTGTLSGGSVTVTVSPLDSLTAGTHANIVAVYSGDSNNGGSTSAALATQTVNQRVLSITAPSVGKCYDGTTAPGVVTMGTVTGNLAGETPLVSVNTVSPYADAAVGAAYSVTVSYTLTDNGSFKAANYALANSEITNASIVDTAVWNITATSATWSTPANWLNYIVGTGSNNTADFNQVDITADTTVNLTEPQIIGNLIFGDTAPGTAGSWTLAGSILTLAGTTPTVTVNPLGTSKILTISSGLEGTSGLTKAGPGTLTLSGAKTYTGTTTISAGTLKMASNLITGSPTIQIGNEAILESTGGFTLAANQSVTGTGVAGNVTTTAGTGLITVGNNTVSSSGTLTLTRFSVLGSGNQLTGGDIRSGGTGTNQRGLLVGNSGSGTLTITGGTLTSLGGSANFDGLGTTTASANGTLVINGGTYVNTNSTGTLSLGNGTANAGSGTFTVTSGSATINTLKYNANSTSGSGIVNLDGGTLTLANITLTTGLSKVFNFNGGQFVASANLPAFSGLTLNVKDGGAKIDTGDYSFTLSDPLLNNGSGGLTKSGSGKLTLAGQSTYVGPTTNSAGTLALGIDNALPDTDVAIGSAILDVATFKDTVGSLDVTGSAVINLGAGGTLAFANSSAIDWTGGTLSITGTFVKGTSIRFGTTSGGLTPAQCASISVPGYGRMALDENGYLIPFKATMISFF